MEEQPEASGVSFDFLEGWHLFHLNSFDSVGLPAGLTPPDGRQFREYLKSLPSNSVTAHRFHKTAGFHGISSPSFTPSCPLPGLMEFMSVTQDFEAPNYIRPLSILTHLSLRWLFSDEKLQLHSAHHPSVLQQLLCYCDVRITHRATCWSLPVKYLNLTSCLHYSTDTHIDQNSQTFSHSDLCGQMTWHD